MTTDVGASMNILASGIITAICVIIWDVARWILQTWWLSKKIKESYSVPYCAQCRQKMSENIECSTVKNVEQKNVNLNLNIEQGVNE